MIIAVLLGNRMNDDGTLSELGKLRITLAEKLFSEINPDKIILSGGLANVVAGITEAEAMRSEIINRCIIPSDVLILENKSLTTKQNAQFSVPIANSLGATKIIVCTSKEHATRPYLNPLRLFKRVVKKMGQNIPVEIFTNN